MPRYITTPVIVDAVKWTGINEKEVREELSIPNDVEVEITKHQHLLVPTFNGLTPCVPGNWIVQAIPNDEDSPLALPQIFTQDEFETNFKRLADDGEKASPIILLDS